MAKTMTYQIDADEAKQIEAAVNECVAEMKEANQRMENRQLEIDKLKAETRVMLNQIRELRAA
jgi:predicted  nucleic acid-binding Zn-ribbon protein